MPAKKDTSRQERIDMEIIADAYDSDERATGWYCYLDEKLSPLTAICTGKRAISPLKKGDAVEVSGVAPEDEARGHVLLAGRL
jgi:hypothetical protein